MKFAQPVIKRIPEPVRKFWAKAILLIGIVAVYALSIIIDGPSIRDLDHLALSGVTFLILGLWVSMNVQDRMTMAIDQLDKRGGIVGLNGAENFTKALEKNAFIWTVLITVAIAASFWFGLKWEDASTKFAVEWTIGGTLFGFIVSLQLGRMVSYSLMNRYLKKEKISIISHPGHPDSLGGIKPLGYYFFFHAILFAIPLFHLGAWSLLIPGWEYWDYSVWRSAYALLFGVTLVLFLICCVWPILGLHEAMRERKATLLASNEPLSASIRELQEKIELTTDFPKKNEMSENLLVMTGHYYQIESMPTWPFNLKTLQSFALKLPLGLLGPLIGSISNLNTLNL